jgi:glutamate-ammonia-ligase adenylyltransferase
VPTPSDLFLSPDLTEDQARAYLASLGFRDAVAADTHLQALAEDLVVREALGRLASDLLPSLLESPDPDAAVVGLSRYLAARTGRSMFLDYLREDPRALHVLTYVLGASPFLSEILIRNPEYFHWLISQFERSAPDLRDLEEEIEAQLRTIEDPAEALDTLKRWKRRETLRIAARDLLRRETVETATAQISDLAGVVVDTALEIVSRQLLAAEERDAMPGAFAVIGMGKLGGRELNYSSDIDLVYVYDSTDEDDSSARDFFHRLGRRLTAALGEHTGESYLYRVDLRLRPGGAKGNIAYSLEEYDEYYTAWGETFERFALIKARPIAGDRQLGRRFIDRVQPFVYRKYLDRAALEELSRYKARSDQALGGKADERNVKAGRGGIREIELFTQVFQLSYGGQMPSLRQPSTLAGLEALVPAGLVPKSVQQELSRAYVFLRSVEHRLQLVQENQTHRMSNEAHERVVSARRLGLGSSEDLDKQLAAYRDRVNAIYLDLFEHKKDSSEFEARQLFRILNKDVPEPEAIAYLDGCRLSPGRATLDAMLSMNQAAAVAQAPAVARNVVANLLAAQMPRLAECARPEQVVTRLEQLAACTGGPIHFYRSLLEHRALCEAAILTLDSGDLPSLRLIRYPELLDSLILPPEDIDTAGRKIASALDWREDLDGESRMNQVRRLKNLEEFKVVLEWLAGGDLDLLQEKLSLIAELCVERAARWHAPHSVERKSWAVMALGKLGGIELAVHSDLDLVVFYEGDPDDGPAFEGYQAFVTAMTTFLDRPTAEGTVYRVDTRLRPEGRKGALAIPVSMFQRYLDTRAEPWERLAWTRCRPLAAPPGMAGRIQDLVAAFVYGPWDERMPGTMRDVRARMERELGHEGGQRFDFKVGKGGLADIDFMLQLIQIREGHQRPEFRIAGTRRLLQAFPDTPFLSSGEAQLLRGAHAFLRSLELMARLETDTNLSWISSDAAEVAALAVRMGFARPSAGEKLLDKYRETTTAVRNLYLQVIERLGAIVDRR